MWEKIKEKFGERAYRTARTFFQVAVGTAASLITTALVGMVNGAVNEKAIGIIVLVAISSGLAAVMNGSGNPQASEIAGGLAKLNEELTEKITDSTESGEK